MSSFYKMMPKNQSFKFTKFKKKFKKGKPCAHCGKILASQQMSVDHIIPLEQFNGSPFDTENWQVLCLPCHRTKTKLENEESLKRLAEYGKGQNEDHK